MSGSPSREFTPSNTRGRNSTGNRKGGDGNSNDDESLTKREKSKSPTKDRGRSKSPSKFGEKDFERKKVSTDSAKRRQNALAKVKGLKLDPSQWSRQELIDKLNGFAHFSIDDKSGIATLSSEGRRLLSEDVQVLLEIMRRVTEIQVVNLSGCGLTDDIFLQILDPGLIGLRHLRELRIQSNLLSSSSVNGIVQTFAKLSRKLVVLDMQFNSLLFEDGKDLFSAFSASIVDLNGFPMEKIMQEASTLEVLDFSNKGLRLAELGLVCGLMEHLKKLTEVNLANNRLSASGLALLVETLKRTKHVTAIDISHNPVTDDERDNMGVAALLAFARSSTQLQKVTCDGIFKEGSKEENILTQSLMANRSVVGHLDGSHFNKFCQTLIERTARTPHRTPAVQWHSGTINRIDLQFIKNNHVPQKTVDVFHDDGSGRDVIYINNMSLPSSGNIIEF